MKTIKLFLTAKPWLWMAVACFCGLLVVPSSWATDIQVAVDRNPVSMDESFQITFTANASPDDDPDFSPLDTQFTIISQSNSSSSSWINGQSSKTIKWTLKVMAKQAGDLQIPPIKFGADVSPATPITVNAQQTTPANLPTDEELFIDLEATPEQPFIQSQVLVTLRIYTKVQIVQASLSDLELADAVVEKLGDDSNYNAAVNGVGYSVTERKYAVFPQKSGLLTIKPLLLTADVLTSSRSGGFFSSQMTRTKRVQSKALSLDVKPAPKDFTGAHWLTAEQVQLNQEWSGDIEQLPVGEPLTRTISLLVRGATIGQLPELKTVNTDSQLKTYPDQPVLQEQKKADGLLSYRAEKCALIPSKPGRYTLPAIEIPWFNTKTQQMEVARIPETTLTAVAAAGAQTAAVSPAPQPAATPASPSGVTPVVLSSQPQPWFWMAVSGMFALAWLITLWLYWRKPSREKLPAGLQAPEPRDQEWVQNLKVACQNNDAAAAKLALLAWGRQLDAANLSAVAELSEARLRDEILTLNAFLYGKTTGVWQGKKLFQAFTEHKARAKVTQKQDNSLEPLYRL